MQSTAQEVALYRVDSHLCNSRSEGSEDAPSLQRFRKQLEKYKGGNKLRVIKGEGTPLTPTKSDLRCDGGDQTH